MTPPQDSVSAVERRFWLIVHEPGMIPERKGSWPLADTAKVLREFIAARPAAYLHVLTVDASGKPEIDHGPQVLQMLDGRSMSVGRKHNARTFAAHSAALAVPINKIGEDAKGMFACPICGDDKLHHHTPAVVDAYQNKRSRS